MSEPGYDGKKASELRREFDALFSRAPESGAGACEDFLIIRLAGMAYAVRLIDTSGLFQNKKITRLPTNVPSLLGIAGFRGTIVPIYNLRALMGHAIDGTAKWIFLTRSNAAFVFDDLVGYTRISKDAVLPANIADAARKHVREVVRTDSLTPIVDLASILDSIRVSLGAPSFKKE